MKGFDACSSCLIMATPVPIDRPTALVATTMLVAALSWSRPRWAIALILAALPFFTHHPSSFPTVLLIVLLAALEIVYVLRVRPSWSRTREAVSSQPLLLLGALFAGAAVLSLSSLPLVGIWREHAAVAGSEPWTAWPRLLLDWILLTEVRREFPITSAALVVQAYLLALIVWRETRASRGTGVLFAAAITVGTIIFVALGLLEAFGAMSLDTLRGSASVYFREGTLQSASGNPGWFSQYLVYALPYALVLLAGTSAPGLRMVWLGGATGLMVFALLVSWQRGGWIFGAVVVGYLVVAATLVRSRIRTPSDGGARDGAWRTMVLAGFVFVLIIAAFSLWTAKARPGGTVLDTQAYLTPLKSGADADRLSYVWAGTMIAALHPVLGGGHESFAYRYRTYFEAPGGPFHRSTVRVPEAASAHNVFVQTLAGTGVIGLALLVGILVVAAWTAVRTFRAPGTDQPRRAVLLAAFGSLVGIASYGLVQEVFYVHALRILFFVGIGLVAGGAADGVRWPARAGRRLWSALLIAFVAHLGYEYVWPGPGRLLRSADPTGLYAEEHGPQGSRQQWSTDWATWPVPPGATSYMLRVRSVAPYQQEVTIEPCGSSRRRVVLPDHDWHPIGGVLEGCGPGARLQLRVVPGWRPRGDPRLLGVLTADVRFE
jgi:hypothetical protein